MIILIHSSKTMRLPSESGKVLRRPELIHQAEQLGAYLKTLSPAQLAKVMHISSTLADKTHSLIKSWTSDPSLQTLAIDSFVGDIYSGLQASELSAADRDYADKTLRILSGLYGIIRPCDGIFPYRLEMAYRLPKDNLTNLYKFWGSQVADTLPKQGIIVNTSSVEYSQVVLPFVDPSRIITPQFLTMDPKTKQPTFVVVHAKIARGAYARWLITSRATDNSDFSVFNDLGYSYDLKLSTPQNPAFICQAFGGLGLSMRLTPVKSVQTALI